MVEQCSKDVLSQYGISLKRAAANYMNNLGKMGSLNVIDNGPDGISLQWNVEEYKVVDSCSEWSIVVSDNALDANGTDETSPGGGRDSNGTEKSNMTKIETKSSDLKGLEVSKNELKLIDKYGVVLFVYSFHSSHIENFMSYLERANYIQKVKRSFYIFVDYTERDKLHKSFAELDISGLINPRRGQGWKPYGGTLNMLAALGQNFMPKNRDDLSTSSPSTPERVCDPGELLHTAEANNVEKMVVSMSSLETTHDISHLPTLTSIKRGPPLTSSQLTEFLNSDRSDREIEAIKKIIFHGGVEPNVRPDVWKLLLHYDLWEDTEKEREDRRIFKKQEYYRMKKQWMSFSEQQENNFADYRDRKCQIEKDVKRTDRNLEYFEGEDNPNLVKLQNILMTYIMYNFDLGYVQGMSDLLAPILMLMENEEEAFWCFVGFMDKVFHNFDIDQAGMKNQLKDVNSLLAYTNPKLFHYICEQKSENMYFCFRWLLVWFKREFSNQDILSLWEVLFTDLPCKNFHLFIALAILDEEAFIFMDNNYQFNEILKHINELSGNIDLNKILTKAESIYIQVKNSTKLTDDIRRIIGELPSKATTDEGRSDDERLMDGVGKNGGERSAQGHQTPSSNGTSPNSSDREAIYEMGIQHSFL